MTTTTSRATFDGKVFIPIGPVDLSPGQQIEFRVVSDDERPRGSPAALLAAIRGEPHLSAEDMDELERSIEVGKMPPTSGDIFKDLAE